MRLSSPMPRAMGFGQMGGQANLQAGGSFQASFSSARADASSHTEVSITAMQVGGQGAQLRFVGAEADKIRAQMNAFAAAVQRWPATGAPPSASGQPRPARSSAGRPG